MTKRVLTFSAMLAVLAAAVLAILQILDLVSFQEATKSLGKVLSVIIVASAAVVLMIALARIGTRR